MDFGGFAMRRAASIRFSAARLAFFQSSVDGG
jgi:hypothetical protein